jgi:hypothetical protein
MLWVSTPPSLLIKTNHKGLLDWDERVVDTIIAGESDPQKLRVTQTCLNLAALLLFPPAPAAGVRTALGVILLFTGLWMKYAPTNFSRSYGAHRAQRTRPALVYDKENRRGARR